MKRDAYLFGPFIGEFEWEMYRFAPFAIHLKKKSPYSKIIVFTRSDRFDLYGKYADILVPLNLKNDKKYKQKKFAAQGFERRKYKLIADYFFKKYEKRFNILDHFYPDISTWRYRIKWQFSINEMDYDFQPRNTNKEIVGHLVDSPNNVLVNFRDSEIRHSLVERDYNPFMIDWFEDICEKKNSSSFIGCLILYLKSCKFVVGNVDSSISKLALLLKIPVISINESMSYDEINLLNPFNTPVINCYDINEGIDIYEDNF
jgi:hypothetical protein